MQAAAGKESTQEGIAQRDVSRRRGLYLLCGEACLSLVDGLGIDHRMQNRRGQRGRKFRGHIRRHGDAELRRRRKHRHGELAAVAAQPGDFALNLRAGATYQADGNAAKAITRPAPARVSPMPLALELVR